MKTFRYYLLLAPAVLLSVSIVLIPGVMTAVVSFTSWNGISPELGICWD